MGFKKPHIAVILGLVALVVALIFQIIGLAANGWLQQKNVDYVRGIWKECRNGVCVDYPDYDLEAGDYVVRALSILGLIFIVLALVAGSLIMFIDKKVVTLIAGGVAITAGVFMVVEFVVFIGYTIARDLLEPMNMSYCFALTVVASVLSLAAGAAFILSNKL